MLTSWEGQMLLAIQQRIKEKVPAIRYVDQDLLQLEVYEVRPAVPFPCLLVDFEGTKFDQLGGLVEMGDTLIKIRIGFAPYSASNSLAPEAVREKALDFYEIENAVFKALKGWAPVVDGCDLCQPLNRVSNNKEVREDTLRVRAITWATSYEDYNAEEQVNKTQSGLELELE